MKKILHAILAAVTSPTAVKAEKNLAVFIAVRVAIALGASAGLVAFIQHFA